MTKKNIKMNWEKVVIITLAVGLLFSLIKHKGTEEKTTKQEPVKIYVGHETNKPMKNFSREDAVDSLTEIIVGVEKDINNKDRSIEDGLKILDNNKKDMPDVLRKEVIDKIYLAEDFGDDLFNRQFATSSLLLYNKIIKDSTKEKTINPLIEQYDEVVYLDNKLMTAHIPLDIYIGRSTGIAFEMQYIDGKWKLNPYTAMMSLHLMGVLDETQQLNK